MKVIVVHEWEDSQKDAVNNFFNQLVNMARSKKLPKGMKLEKISISQESKTAICEWDVDNMDLLVQAAKQFNITWKIKPFTPQVLYEHKGIF
ncbi:conserved hypothetical protein [Sulfolobus islandicus L.S.2.15]|jgi:hypothetical protein|uniref:DUF4242 domain-containing protein n=2 Tax=Saccharolobus islandicus TaxID=43080 RepID=C3MNP4_SACI2|nr:hypothetical protein [Sulfolobus islandicus]ACP35007.1 conserved hypothetical protein [Sulfolobus islandicus L.S.2.15]ADB86425.1 conserved hypothetical protein [Sulfolobus islandicus L.D.8.5]